MTIDEFRKYMDIAISFTGDDLPKDHWSAIKKAFSETDWDFGGCGCDCGAPNADDDPDPELVGVWGQFVTEDGDTFMIPFDEDDT